MRLADIRCWLFLTVLLACCFVSVFAGETVKQPTADSWPRFRGTNGNGSSQDKDVPIKFGPSENVLWKFPLPGTGNSSPIIWDKHLFLQSASDDSKQRNLLCLDTTNGKIRWQRSIAAVFAKIRPDSSQASSTPTTDGEAVYVSFWDGKEILVAAYDFQGKKLWDKNLGLFNSQHGAGASPIVYQDKLILANDMDKDDFDSKVPNARPSMLIALDKRTGRLLWETPRIAERACYSAPFLLQSAGQKEPTLIVLSTTALTGYNVETGAKLWEARGWQDHAIKNPMRTVASPVLADGVLCLCSGGDAGRFAIGLALPRPGKAESPQRLWENRKDFPYVPTPVARGEHFYFVNDAGFAGCYQARTGKREWFERLGATGFHASPLMIDGKIFAVNAAGDVFVFAAEPTFKLLARSELGETVRATPAVAGGRLYIRGERHLFCIGNGRTRGRGVEGVALRMLLTPNASPPSTGERGESGNGPMDLGLRDHVILVTGGAKGIGAEAAKVLASEGAVPVIIGRNNTDNSAAVAAIETAGHRAFAVQAELIHTEACREAVERAAALGGRIDGLVNNAGVNDGVGLETGDTDRFLASLRKNLVHYYDMAHFALPWLKHSRGAIVNIGSKVAETGQGGTSAYAAANGGRNALTREWAVELRQYGIRVNAVIVAECWTPMYAQWLRTQPHADAARRRIEARIPFEQRMTTAGEIADMIAFLLSPRSSHTTGQLIHVDGGYVHLDRALAAT